jgi:energy-converting hydrogenase Eha subunit C
MPADIIGPLLVVVAVVVTPLGTAGVIRPTDEAVVTAALEDAIIVVIVTLGALDLAKVAAIELVEPIN